VTFSRLQLEERKKANKKLQDIDLTGSWELDQVPSFHDYCTYDDPKTKTSKQGNICSKHVDRDSSPSLDIHLERDSLSEFFLPTNRYQLLFFSDDNQESVSKMM
jgi:hypothetical protein